MKNSVDNEESTEVLLILDTLKVQIKETDMKLNQDIIWSLHHKKITSKMASSLMNDNNYSTHIANNLIAMATTIYAVYDNEKLNIERELALNTNDIESLVTQ